MITNNQESRAEQDTAANTIAQGANQYVDGNIRPDETPEEHESDNEGSGYTKQTEVNQPPSGNDASYDEQTGVKPPDQKEFPGINAPEINQGTDSGRNGRQDNPGTGAI